MHVVKGLGAFLLLAFLAGFLLYTARVSEPRAVTENDTQVKIETRKEKPNGTGLPQDEEREGRAETPVESLQCIECHKQIYDEWRADEHATAWVEDAYVYYTDNHTKTECLSCHAPKSMLEVGIRSQPQIRDKYRADGVDCFACHMKNGRSHGTLGSKAVCGGIEEPDLKTSQACYHCHSAHNLFKEYLASEYYQRGVTCQDCHMKKVRRPVADGGPIRDTRVHLMHAGGHDAEALKKVLTLDLEVVDSELVVTVTNVGAAHGVPGEINNRVIFMDVSILINRGTKTEEDLEEVDAFPAIFRAPPRLSRDTIPSTQVMPGIPRVFRRKLSVRQGVVVARLSYKLEPYILNADATLMVEKRIEF